MMPEARDRLAKPVDIAAAFVRHRSAARGVFMDGDRESPLRQGPVTAMGTPGPMGSAALRGGLGTPRAATVSGRNLYGTPVVGRRNSPAGSARRARGRSTNSPLPSWYPRTPLRDITAVVRAIERRRAQLREIDSQEMPEGSRLLDSSLAGSSAQLEHSSSMISPIPNIGIKHCTPAGKVSKLLLDIANANQTTGDSDCLTPQKKLLNSIDTVEKVVKQELQMLKRTPTAKKAEREKRVRTLMSMR